MRKPSNNILPEPPWLSKLQTAFTNYATDIKVVCSVSTHANGHGKRYLKKNYALNTLIITPDNQKSVYNLCTWFWILDLTKEKLQYIPILETKNGQRTLNRNQHYIPRPTRRIMDWNSQPRLLYYHPSMHKLTQINRNNFPVAPEKDIAVEVCRRQ